MTDLPVPRTEIALRLKKIEGQIRGIQKMVLNERQCTDIMIQLAAAKAGLESVAGKVLKNYTNICLNEESPEEVGAALARAVSIWVGGRA
ncbi:MAG: metal-sensitive transcriptional regulator [Bacteroidetes bacterium]|jgi:CsoR family transcriptional regulator, copper-sensing transcriptional repressor|nr:metal-sensitive transcriptional regulator [Chloroflexota bacterium]MBT7092425.1 metal-sensitive transcriptional regulator [Bacteroidota bacterium]MBT7289525.1 metal-sensitive transcriptional regulator [Chloroflexota bacterium]